MRELIGIATRAIEVCAVLIIVGGIVYGVVLFILRRGAQAAGAYRALRNIIGNSLLLGLEFLVAADIIRTVLLDLTVTNVATLGLLVFVRTFLSWALLIEMEQRWPWGAKARSGEGG